MKSMLLNPQFYENQSTLPLKPANLGFLCLAAESIPLCGLMGLSQKEDFSAWTFGQSFKR